MSRHAYFYSLTAERSALLHDPLHQPRHRRDLFAEWTELVASLRPVLRGLADHIAGQLHTINRARAQVLPIERHVVIKGGDLS